ncbi:MAG: hypothetical protein AAFX06_25425 [Planctomycetota bacterium]
MDTASKESRSQLASTTLIVFKLTSSLLGTLCSFAAVSPVIALICGLDRFSILEGMACFAVYAASSVPFWISFVAAKRGDIHRACNACVIGLFLNCILVFFTNQILGL